MIRTIKTKPFLTIAALVLVSLTLLSVQAVRAQATAPEPQDDSTSFCDEVTTNVPTYCTERENRTSTSTGTSAVDDTSSPLLGKNSIFYRIIQLVTIITGALSVIMIIVGGFRYVVSGGDSNATKGAKDTILYAVIGLVVVIFAQTIITFVLSRL